MKRLPHWRMEWSPLEFFEWAKSDSRALIDQYLLRMTPHAFPTFDRYYDFLEHTGESFNVSPQSVVLRGSCLIGFSITPSNDKLWQTYDDESDLDLAIIDAELYDNTERKLRRWEVTRRTGIVQEKKPDADKIRGRQRDRFYHCCRIHDLPGHITGNYRDAIEMITDACYSGPRRPVKVFLYRDWWAVRGRYESDFRKLADKVEAGHLIAPTDAALQRLRLPDQSPPRSPLPKGRGR
jgi:hypothetical protein